jgi:hypothetical protein
MQGRRTAGRWSILGKIPWTFLLILYLLVTYFQHIALEGVVGYVFVGLATFVLFVEFFKSGQVSAAAFIVDQLFALVAVIAATVLLTYLYFVLAKVPNFFYGFGYAVILGDAILSPFNAYRMALRDFDVIA